jgi:hypothetical protein
MTDWTQEEDEAFNNVEKHSNLGKQILREIGQPYHFQKREWVGLTEEEIDVIYEQHHDQYAQCISVNWGYERAIEAKLKEKNEKN